MSFFFGKRRKKVIRSAPKSIFISDSAQPSDLFGIAGGEDEIVFRSSIGSYRPSFSYMTLDCKGLAIYKSKAQWIAHMKEIQDYRRDSTANRDFKNAPELVLPILQISAISDAHAKWIRIFTSIHQFAIKVKTTEIRNLWIKAISDTKKSVLDLKGTESPNDPNVFNLLVHVIEGNHISFDTVDNSCQNLYFRAFIDAGMDRYSPKPIDIVANAVAFSGKELVLMDDEGIDQDLEGLDLDSDEDITNEFTPSDQDARNIKAHQLLQDHVNHSSSNEKLSQIAVEQSSRKSSQKSDSDYLVEDFDMTSLSMLEVLGSPNSTMPPIRRSPSRNYDPYDFCSSIMFASSLMPKTHSPIWNSVFGYKGIDLHELFLLDIFDEKKGYVGQVRIPLSKLFTSLNANPRRISAELNSNIFFKEDWFPITYENSRVPGRILIKLCLTTLAVAEAEENTPLFTVDNFPSEVEPSTREEILCILSDPSQSPSNPFVYLEKISIFCTTWNVGNASPPDDLSPWIPLDRKFSIYIIGVQECNYSPRKQFRNSSQDFLLSLSSHLGPSYQCVRYVSLLSIRMAIFVRWDLVPEIFDIKTSTVPTGIANVMGNKGGVVISMLIKDTSFCFVNCHLAAHQPKVKARNSNIRDIVLNSISSIGNKRNDLCSQFNHVIWMGDLNYRLNYDSDCEEYTPSEQRFNELVTLIEKNQIQELIPLDQLSTEISNGKILYGFSEAPIFFHPTFKFRLDSILEYDSKRAPAWCDRILWKSLEGNICHLEPMKYTSISDFNTSDHKPVALHANVPIFYKLSKENYSTPTKRFKIEGLFTRLTLTDLQKDRLPASIHGRAFAEIRSEFIGDTLLQDVDLNDERKVIDFNSFNLLYDNIRRIPSSIITFCMRSSDQSIIGHGSVLLSNMDFDSISSTLEKASKIVAESSASLPKLSRARLLKKSNFVSSDFRRHESSNNPAQTRKSIHRTRAISSKSIYSAVPSSANFSRRWRQQSISEISGPSDDEKFEQRKNYFPGKFTPDNTSDSLPSATTPNLSKVYNLDTEFECSICSGSQYIAKLKGTLRLRFLP